MGEGGAAVGREGVWRKTTAGKAEPLDSVGGASVCVWCEGGMTGRKDSAGAGVDWPEVGSCVGVLRKEGNAGVSGRSSSKREGSGAEAREREGFEGGREGGREDEGHVVGCWGNGYEGTRGSAAGSGSEGRGLESVVPNAASSRESSFVSSAVSCSEGRASPSPPTGRPPAGPGTGERPSRNAFAMSAAFHFEYLILSRF